MEAEAPPQYRRFSARPGLVPQSSSELPPYTRRRRETVSALPRREPTEHVFQLVDGRSKPWAIMRVLSSAKSSKSLPTFYEKEPVTGSLEVTVDKGDSIQAITLSVTGRIITGAGSGDCYTFLNITFPIWSKSSSDVRTSSSQGGSSRKLQGNYKWPFSIPLPKIVNIPSGSGEPQSCPLPETFMERGCRVSIQYDLAMRIARGKLRADNTLTTAFGYVPSTRPEAASLLRQLAYQEGCPVPGPEADPEGWETLRSFSTRGVVFNARVIEARCTLSLAKPLCYTRGSVIPCFLALECRDAQALDLLANPKAIRVYLRRRVRYYNSPCPHNRPDVAWKDTIEDLGRAIWWPSIVHNGSTRYLEGEIPLAKDLKPSTSIAHFSVSYTVVVCPFDVSGFASSDSQALFAEPVEIATMYSRGPKPRSSAPPAYASVSVSSTADDFHATLRGFTWNA